LAKLPSARRLPELRFHRFHSDRFRAEIGGTAEWVKHGANSGWRA